MGRRPGSKNKPKDGSQPAAKTPKAAKNSPSQGHNSELTDAEKRSLLLQGLKKIEGLTEEKDGIVAKIRNAHKSVQAAGFTPKQIKWALDARKDPKAAAEEWEANRNVARMINHPIGSPDLFDAADEEARIKAAGEEGEMAGAAGDPCDPMPKYSPGSEEGQEWIRRWHVGQGALAATVGRGNNVTLIRPAPVERQKDEFEDGLDAASKPLDSAPGTQEAGTEPAGAEEKVDVETVPPAKTGGYKFAAEGDAFLKEQIAKNAEADKADAATKAAKRSGAA